MERRFLEQCRTPSRTGRGRRLGVSALLLALCGALAAACDAPDRADRGAVLYRRHCASCHGVGGHGDGPLAASLQRPPADLTRLAGGGGEFDEARVMATIDGRRMVAEHGPRDMPVWGAVFEEQLSGEPYGVYEGVARTRALSDYLRTLQKP